MLLLIRERRVKQLCPYTYEHRTLVHVYNYYTFFSSLQGIGFLDAMSALWDRRKFSDVAVDSECIKWLQLLLGLVDITGDHPDVHMKKFLGRTGVVKRYRTTIVKQVMQQL